MGSVSGNRNVPFAARYGASSRSNASSPAGTG
jgi:hypothetical protein